MITHAEMQVRLLQAENTIIEQKEFIAKLSNALQWYVDTDGVYEGCKRLEAEKILAELKRFVYNPEAKD